MRLITILLLGLAVGGAVLCHQTAPKPAPALVLSEDATIQTVEFYEHGCYMTDVARTHFIRTDEGTMVRFELYGNQEDYQELAGPELLEEVQTILDTYDVLGWAGFSGHNPNVLDGSSFLLEITFSDGSRLTARGENRFPKNYSEVMSALDSLAAPAREHLLQQLQEQDQQR